MMAFVLSLVLFGFILVVATSPYVAALADTALVVDDECISSGDDGVEECGLNALQQRRLQVSVSPDSESGESIPLADSDEPNTTSIPAENEASTTIRPDPPTCGSIDAPENAECRKVVIWAAYGGRWDPQGAVWFQDLTMITGRSIANATLVDFQRLYFCSPPGGVACGLPPCHCSIPPCDKCFGGTPQQEVRPGCENDTSSISCTPPKTPMGYKGQAWPAMSIPGTKAMHIFTIGDWGGMDGSLNPIEDRAPIVAYDWGKRPGPSVFPRTRWDKYHKVELCDHKQFVECFNAEVSLNASTNDTNDTNDTVDASASHCEVSCGFVTGVDDQPQTLVAAALKQRAAEKDPDFLLNVGDNFYWGGIEKTCGTPMDEISFTAHHQFNQIFEGVYQGEGLSKKPWLSVLGNHDWGGRVFNNGWDQQIAYTWASDRWIMPAPYWSQHIEYPDLDFSADIYMLDSNFIDAKEPDRDSEHNLCGSKHNPPNASCTVADGPDSVESCPQFFQDLWKEQQTWLELEIAKSTATWQIIVTHFPCGHEMEWYKKLHQRFGLDLLVTGHRHDQELWRPSDWWKNHMGGLTCIVTGGGGGITSEATPDPDHTEDWYGEGQYGFYDLTISKEELLIQSINWNGSILLNHTLFPN